MCACLTAKFAFFSRADSGVLLTAINAQVSDSTFSINQAAKNVSHNQAAPSSRVSSAQEDPDNSFIKLQLRWTMLRNHRDTDLYWFFDDDPKVIEQCEFAARLRKQINFLRDNFSTQLVEMARTNLPDLWLDLMGSPAPNFNTSIVERMCQVHKCESSELAVISHQEFTKERYKYELLWIDKLERIKSVIEVIRANQIIHAMSRSDLMKLETSLERQTIDTIRQLMALVEFQQRHAQVIELDASQEI